MEPERKTWQAWPTPLRTTVSFVPASASCQLSFGHGTKFDRSYEKKNCPYEQPGSSSIANTRAAYLGPISPRLQVRDLFPLTPLNQYLCSAYHIQPIVEIFSPLNSAIPEPGRPFPLPSIARSTSLRHWLRMKMFGRQ